MLLYFYSIFGSPSKNGDVGECNALLRTSQQLFSTFLHPRMLKKEETGVTGHTHTQKKIRCIRIWKLLVDWDDTVATSQMEMTLFRKPSLLLCKSTS